MGGGSNTPIKAPATATATPAAPTVPMQNYPAFQPGQLGLLADQMSAGFGGTPAANQGILSNMYHDVQVPMISRPEQIDQYLKQMAAKPATGGTSVPIVPGKVPVAPGRTTVPLKKTGNFQVHRGRDN